MSPDTDRPLRTGPRLTDPRRLQAARWLFGAC